jgi:hypothetical protein
MPQKLLDVLMLGRCAHEFSWPRRAVDGDYYQVCLICAAEYRYDWKTMRRTERLQQTLAESATPRRSRSHSRRPTWVPRARRLKLDAPIRYRAKNLGSWAEGIIDNLSQSGLFLHGPLALPLNTLVEMVFEMPEEISGQKNSTVLCQGRIIRSKQGKDARDGLTLAASIVDYRFLRQS